MRELQRPRIFVPGYGTIEKENFTEEHYKALMDSLPPEWPKERAIAKWFTPKSKSLGESIGDNSEKPAKSETKQENPNERQLAAQEYKEITGKRAGSRWDAEGIREKLKEWKAGHPEGE